MYLMHSSGLMSVAIKSACLSRQGRDVGCGQRGRISELQFWFRADAKTGTMYQIMFVQTSPVTFQLNQSDVNLSCRNFIHLLLDAQHGAHVSSDGVGVPIQPPSLSRRRVSRARACLKRACLGVQRQNRQLV